MRKRTEGSWRLIFPVLALALAAGPAPAAEAKAKTLMAGLNFDYFSRTAVWDGDAETSRILANLISARAEFELGKGATLSLSAGLSLSDFKGLTFGDLPVTLEYDAAPIKGVFLGAEIEAPLLDFGDFEIGAAGRFVSSFGMSKTWPLEGFAVEGEAQGRPNWIEASAGPRLVYKHTDRFIPYLEVDALWLRADFRMDETLEDLHGLETKRIKGNFSLGAFLGADIRISERLALKAKAGIIPYAGGVDGLASVGLFYVF